MVENYNCRFPHMFFSIFFAFFSPKIVFFLLLLLFCVFFFRIVFIDFIFFNMELVENLALYFFL